MKYLYSGGLQIRSEDSKEKLLNVNTFIKGELAFHQLYPEIQLGDYPIAQDCFGDQFLVRDGLVVKLMAETGEVENLNFTWDQFLAWVDEDPEDRLDLPRELELDVGKLLFAYPAFCTEEGSNASIKAIDGIEVIQFHADLARQLNEG